MIVLEEIHTSVLKTLKLLTTYYSPKPWIPPGTYAPRSGRTTVLLHPLHSISTLGKPFAFKIKLYC